MENYVQHFISYLASERGLAQNTLESYGRDLRYFQQYLENNRLTFATGSTNEIIRTYLDELKKQGKAVSTISRNLAALKSFYQYLLKEQHLDADPASKIESPKLEKKLPQVLSVQQVELLLKQPNINLPAGLRDKAMLELLYATGIRVSELITINVNDVNLELGYIKCFGRGAKERVVPLGSIASKCVTQYLRKGRTALVRSKQEEAMFVNHHGRRLTRQGFWKIIKKGPSLPRVATVRGRLVLPGKRPGHWGNTPGDTGISQTGRKSRLPRKCGRWLPQRSDRRGCSG